MLNVADAAVGYMAVEKFDKRRKILTYLANTFHYYVSCNRLKRIRKGFTDKGAPPISLNNGNETSRFNINRSKPYIYDLLCCHGKLHGSYLVCLYMLIKIIYIANNILQLLLLNLFLGFNYNSQGLQLLKDVLKNLMGTNDRMLGANYPPASASGQYANQYPMNPVEKNPFYNLDTPSLYQESVAPLTIDNRPVDSASTALIHRYFPRESACDFRIRMNVDSLVHNYTVQCVLPINLFNEQLFTLLWVWLWFVCVANCYDLICWVVRLLPGSRYKYIVNRLRLKTSESSAKRALNSFVFDYLGPDGVFLLRILTLNASDSVTHDIVQFLWYNYTEGHMLKGPSETYAAHEVRCRNINNQNLRMQQRFSAFQKPVDKNPNKTTGNIEYIDDGGVNQDQQRYVHAEAI